MIWWIFCFMGVFVGPQRTIKMKKKVKNSCFLVQIQCWISAGVCQNHITFHSKIRKRKRRGCGVFGYGIGYPRRQLTGYFLARYTWNFEAFFFGMLMILPPFSLVYHETLKLFFFQGCFIRMFNLKPSFVSSISCLESGKLPPRVAKIRRQECRSLGMCDHSAD